jgi:hypothetical protein
MTDNEPSRKWMDWPQWKLFVVTAGIMTAVLALVLLIQKI